MELARRVPAPKGSIAAAYAEGLRYAGILQADAFDGYRLYLPDREPGPIVEALCWSHARRKFFEFADIAANARRSETATPVSPIAFEAVRCIDGPSTSSARSTACQCRSLAMRQDGSAPLVATLGGWSRAERAKLSRHAAVAKAIDYMITRWQAFTRFLDDGRICLSNNAAERALRGLALGRKSWLFDGSEHGPSGPPSCTRSSTQQSSTRLTRRFG